MKNIQITKGQIFMGLFSIATLLVLLLVGFVASPAEISSGVILATTPVVLMRDELVKKKCDQLLQSLGVEPSSIVLAPSFLKSVLPIANSTSLYKFQLKSDQNILAPQIEQRIDRNDVFIAHRIGYGIMPVVSGNFNRALMATYPNNTVFPAVVGPPAFTPDHLQVFWNARLSLKVGNTVFIPNYDTRNFYYAPETQKSAATNYDQVDGQMDGFVDWTPQIILSGSANIELNVEVPLDSTIAVANLNANTTNYLVAYFRGFLIKEVNSTVMEKISRRLGK